MLSPYRDMEIGAETHVLVIVVIEQLHEVIVLRLSGLFVVLVSIHFSRVLLIRARAQQVRLLRHSIGRHRFTQQNL